MHPQPISLDSLASKHINTLTTIHNNAIAKSQRMTHKVYNRQSRNIAKFIRQQRQFERKSKEQKYDKKSKPVIKKTRFGVTLRYEENQELQYEFEQNKILDLKRVESQKKQKGLLQNTSSTGFKRGLLKKVSMIKGHNSLRSNMVQPRALQIKVNREANVRSVGNRNRMPTKDQLSPGFSPIRRTTGGQNRRVNTLYEQPPSHRNDSPIQKRPQTFTNSSNPIIKMTRDKMQRSIRTLHRVAWMAHYLRGKPKQAESSDEFKQHMKRFIFDRDAAIQASDLKYMIARRYNLLNYHLEDLYQKKMKQLQEHVTSVERQKLISADEYALLDSLSKHSILSMLTHKKKTQKIMQAAQNKPSPIYIQNKDKIKSQQQVNKNTINFNLPYAQFVSERQTKTSIYRIASMNSMVYLRLAFSLYDKNHNGKVDEDDLLQAISLSRVMPQLQSDILIMSSIMLTPKRPSKKTKKFQRELTEPIRSTMLSIEDSLMAALVKSQFSEEQSEEDKNQKTTAGFSPDKFYVFFQQKQNQKKKEVSPIPPQQLVIPLTFPAFCKAFRNKRPAILYDVLKFILGAHNDDFIDYNESESMPSSGKKRVVTLGDVVPEESLEEKWNSRLKETNNMLYKLVTTKQY